MRHGGNMAVLMLLVALAGGAASSSWQRRWHRRLSQLSRHSTSLDEPDSSSSGDYGSSSDPGAGRSQLKQLLHRHHSQRQRKTSPKNKRLNSRNEICLFKALRRCGNQLITDISDNPDFENRCSTKEEFLDCMSRMQRGGCRAKHSRHGPSRALVDQYQQRLRRILRATRGCVIGVDLSAQQ